MQIQTVNQRSLTLQPENLTLPTWGGLSIPGRVKQGGPSARPGERAGSHSPRRMCHPVRGRRHSRYLSRHRQLGAKLHILGRLLSRPPVPHFQWPDSAASPAAQPPCAFSGELFLVFG